MVYIKPRPKPVLITRLWGVLEIQTNATFHPNIGSLKTTIEEEWNKMYEEFMLKASRLFPKCAVTRI